MVVLVVVASWGHKMMALEAIQAFQMVRLIQTFTEDYYPTMDVFQNMNLAVGITDFIITGT